MVYNIDTLSLSFYIFDASLCIFRLAMSMTIFAYLKLVRYVREISKGVVVVLSIQSSPTLGDPMNQTSPHVSVMYHCVELS